MTDGCCDHRGRDEHGCWDCYNTGHTHAGRCEWSDPSDPVVIGLASSLNASFDHRIDTGYTWKEWNEMDEKEQEDIVAQLVWQNLDVWVVDDE